MTKIEVNGALTNAIKIGRGIRQGCPLSMALYAICSDPIARKIVNNKKIRPFTIGNEPIKLQQYADDVTCYLNNETDIRHIFEEFNSYERATGQKLNSAKTEILHINKPKASQKTNIGYDNHKHPTIKILGQYYGEDQIRITWHEKKMKINRILQNHLHRKLTWVGKRTILNTLATTQLIYNARIIPPPKEDQKEIEKTYFNFIWAPTKMEAISRKTMIAEKEEGGFAMPDIESRTKTCQLEKLAIIKNMQNPTEIWHKHAIYELGTKTKEINPKLYKNNEIHKDKTPANWIKILETSRGIAWSEEEWKEATHKEMYKAIKKAKENATPLFTKLGKKVRWKRVLQEKSFGHKTITNKEMITNYRVAREGYIFGEKRRQRNLLFDNHMKRLDLDCKFCDSKEDNTHHIIIDCKYTRKIFHNIGTALNINFHEDAIKFNAGNNKMEWIITSIIKRTILDQKIALDIDNRKIGDERLEKKIMRRIKNRLEILPLSVRQTITLTKVNEYLEN